LVALPIGFGGDTFCGFHSVVGRFHSGSHGFNPDIAVFLRESIFGFFVAPMFLNGSFRHDVPLRYSNKNDLDTPRLRVDGRQ
jgi:hypothetical protein